VQCVYGQSTHLVVNLYSETKKISVNKMLNHEYFTKKKMKKKSLVSKTYERATNGGKVLDLQEKALLHTEVPT
jgi:fructose-1,6-bisphosphatase